MGQGDLAELLPLQQILDPKSIKHKLVGVIDFQRRLGLIKSTSECNEIRLVLLRREQKSSAIILILTVDHFLHHHCLRYLEDI